MVSAMLPTERVSAAVMIGVMRPRGEATATEMSAVPWTVTLPSPPYVVLSAGTARSALAAALMITSFSENLTSVASANSGVVQIAAWRRAQVKEKKRYRKFEEK